MSFIPSMLIYNPLEALVIILLLSFVSNKRLGLGCIVFNSYLLGILNLICQFAIEGFYGTAIYSMLSTLLQFIVLPCLTYTYCSIIMKVKLEFFKVFLVRVSVSSATLLFALLLNKLCIVDVFNAYFSVYQEALLNLIVRIPQFIALGVAKLIKTKRWFKHERFIKEISREQG